MPTELLDAVVTYHFLHLYQQKNLQFMAECSFSVSALLHLSSRNPCASELVGEERPQKRVLG